MGTDAETATLTIDEVARAAGTTTRRIRSLQSLGLLPRPTLRGRTGLYGTIHLDRLSAVLRLQEQGFSLESLLVLFDALDSGRSLSDVLGPSVPLTRPDRTGHATGHAIDTDTAELYGFPELSPAYRDADGQPLLSLVPTTMWDESEAS